MAARAISAALIHRPENVRYLTGFTGEGCLFVSAQRQAVLTDFRYVEQAARQAPQRGQSGAGGRSGSSSAAPVRMVPRNT